MAKHHGSCHCGAVQFDVEGLELDKLVTCNCSMCGRSGAIMAFVGAPQLSGTVGEEKMTDYQFGKKTIHHGFCSICGVRPFARGRGKDGAEWAMVNARCLEGVNAHELVVSQQYDGQSL
jgi:hypothetical protein